MLCCLCSVEGAAPAVASYVFRCCSWGCSCFAFAGCRPVRPPRRLPQRVLCFGPSRRRGATRNRPNVRSCRYGCVEECSRRKEVPKRPPNSPLVEPVCGAPVADEGKLIVRPSAQYRTAEAIAARVAADQPPRRCARFFGRAARRSGRAGEKTRYLSRLPKEPVRRRVRHPNRLQESATHPSTPRAAVTRRARAPKNVRVAQVKP